MTRIRLKLRNEPRVAWMELSDEVDGFGVFRGPAVLEDRTDAEDWTVHVFVGDRLLDTLVVPVERTQAGSVEGTAGVVTARYAQRSHVLWADADDEVDDAPPSWRLTFTELRAPMGA